LYHLEEDPGETRNLAARMPEKAAILASMLEEIRNDASERKE
jgi:hypothetical protein